MNNTKIDILQEQFDELTPEEKEEFKQVMIGKFNQIKKEQRRAWYSSKAWREIASLGGKACAASLTPEQRHQRAKKANDAREAGRAAKRLKEQAEATDGK